MVVDKILEVDLTSLTKDDAKSLVDNFEGLIDDIERQPKRKTKKSKAELEKNQDKRFKDFIKNNSQNFGGFVISNLKTAIPQLTAILIATTIIQSILKQINEIQSRFTENVDERINIALDNAQQARVDANLQQIIITNSDGSTNPRNSYNSLNESDANVSLLESKYLLENISGFE